MNWVKLDDQFFAHPKVVDLSKDAKLLYLSGLCYAGAQLTDGLITRGALRLIGAMVEVPAEAAAELVAVGLWDAYEDGYKVHDYLEWQTSREQVLVTRAARAEAGRVGGQHSGATRQAKSKQIASTLLKQNRSKIEAETEVETEVEVEVESDIDLGEGGVAVAPLPKRKQAQRARPPALVITDEHRAIAREYFVDVDLEAAKCRDYYAATGKACKDWNAAFRNWLRRAPAYGGTTGGGNGHSRDAPPARKAPIVPIERWTG